MTFCREIPPFRFLAWFNIMHHIIQFFNNAISKTRTAIKSALKGIDKPEHYLIADPKSHSSMLFIPLVKEYDGKVTFCADFVRETEAALWSVPQPPPNGIYIRYSRRVPPAGGV